MNPDRWQKVKTILAEALEQESDKEKTDLIGRSCADDAELLREVESLMAEAQGSDSFEQCAETFAASISPDDPSDVGQRAGAYVITREIGRGGMGTVYLAARADGYFEKQVAIKVLNRGAATEELVRRFRGEREVLARLDHPNIARLMDAGTTEDGRPYFIMEYVEGVPITSYVEKNKLPINDRLVLFLKITAAVEMAHRHSIIHRDLKPSNILVNDEGEPKLLDFGIAKVIRDDNPLEATSLNQQRLTPMSASPEQVKGQPVTVLTDIYALGVVLYELLTGAKPHEFETSHPTDDELVEIVCKRLPVRPSLAVADRHLERELRGDLDAILMRALQKDPTNRYPSAADFAEDIRRHLNGKPVSARRQEPGYTFKTSVRSRRVRVAAIFAALGLVSLVAMRFIGHDLKQRSAPGATKEKIGIAVLPFDSFMADREDNYFSDGVQEAILTDLANVSALKVISRGSVAHYRDRQKNEQDVGKELGVSYLLEGSVQKTGDHVRVDARLVDTRNAATVWAQQYDRKLDDLFGVESELAQAIASQLKTKLSPDEKAAIEITPTKDMLAYDLYLRARESFFQDNHRKAIQLLDQAVQRDPQFALAHALLAEVHLYYYRFDDDRTANRLDRANDAAETALRIAPKLPQSHLAKAQYFYYGVRDYERALAELSTARSLGGTQAEFLDLSALIERRLGKWNDAIGDAERAAELDPQNPFVVNELVESYIAVRRFDDAEKRAERAIEAAITRSGYLWTLRTEALLGMGRIADARVVNAGAPEDMSRLIESIWVALYLRDYAHASDLVSVARSTKGSTWPFEGFSGPLFAGIIARAKGNGAEAQKQFAEAREKVFDQLSQRPNDPELISQLSLLDAGLGRKEAALAEATKAMELCPLTKDAVDGPSYQGMLALVFSWLGDRDSAIAQLEKTISLPRSPSWGELQFSPFWDDLRNDSRFASILSRASLPPAYN